MVAAEFLGQKDGVLIIVGVDHIGLHGDVPSCTEMQEAKGISCQKALLA